NPYRSFAFGPNLEEADRAVLIAERRAAYIQHIRHAVQIDRSVNAQVWSSTLGQGSSQFYVNRHRSVQYSRINSHRLAIDHAVMRINLRWLPDLNVSRLCLRNLQTRLQLV